jgi:NADPH:quinone reductase-like Zn-dependent oxidoreductase
MKAILCTRYGDPEVLQLQEVRKPQPKENEILVKIISTCVNSGDVRVRGLVGNFWMKILMRCILGFTKPSKPILGVVFAGIVESKGSKVTQFQVGDNVFGMTGFKFGTYAEYLTINSNERVMEMPVNASFDEAAALIFGGHTALHFLDKMNITQKSNPSILIIGATGSVGTSAIQIAQSYGAQITAVCSSRGKSLVESLGVKNSILYDQEDFRNLPDQYDFILDAVGKTSRKQCQKLLKKEGIYKTVGGFETATESKSQLELMKMLFEKGELKAVIDRIFSLEEMVEAHRYVDTGRKKGNVVIRVLKES